MPGPFDRMVALGLVSQCDTWDDWCFLQRWIRALKGHWDVEGGWCGSKEEEEKLQEGIRNISWLT